MVEMKEFRGRGEGGHVLLPMPTYIYATSVKAHYADGIHLGFPVV